MKKLSWKAGLALVIGGIALGGTLSSFAQSGDTTEVPEGDAKIAFAHGPGGPGGPGMKGPGGPLVRSETLVEGEEDGTFNTLRADAGTLTAIDGNTLTIEEADGRSVDVTVDDDTEIRRADGAADGDDDGRKREPEEAEVSDLVVGDHVFVHRVKEGDADFVVKHVMAISAEQYEQMEANRAACTDDDDSTECKRPPHHRFRGGPGARPGGEDVVVEESSADAA